MNFYLEIAISNLLVLYIIFEFIRIVFFKKTKNGLVAGLISLVSIFFGIYLLFKYGLLIDYNENTNEYQIPAMAGEMYILGLVCISAGLLFVITSIIKYLIWKINKLKVSS